MAPTYSQPVINARLQGIVTELGALATLIIRAGGTTLSTIQLASPVGTVNGGILTFSGQLLDPSATGTGFADNVIVRDSTGTTAISGLTVGISGGSQDVIISNGLNSTLISAGQTVALLSAQITGS